MTNLKFGNVQNAIQIQLVLIIKLCAHIYQMYDSIDLEESFRFIPRGRKNDIITQAINSIASKNQQQRFKLGKKHLMNAIAYRAPRLDSEARSQSLFFNAVYLLQTSHKKNFFLLLMSYAFMYMVLMSFKKPDNVQNILQWSMLGIFWLDIAMEIYHKYYQTLRKLSKFQQRFYVKVVIFMFLTVDQTIATLIQEDLSSFNRPFLILRCGLPVLYHSVLRKNISAMSALYKDIIVYIFFYATVLLLFAIFANQEIKYSQGEQFDKYTQNFHSLEKSLFIMYSLSSYEGFPDNQIKAIQHHPSIAVFFIVFIFLNLFLFVTIPTSLLFKTFRQSRSIGVLIDEIKQQNSLILAFICLCDNWTDLEINRNKFIKFLLYCFRYKPGYLDYITQITLQLDENANGKIQITQFMQLCKIMQAHGSIFPPMFEDWQRWIQFRQYMNDKFNFKQFVLSFRFKIGVACLILIAIINCFFAIFTKPAIFDIFDDIISFLFVIELLLKFVGIGPENFFKDPWNTTDFVLILGGLALEIAPVPRNIDILFKLGRSYRLAVVGKYFTDKSKYIETSQIYIKTSRLIIQTMMTIPIVIQFFPMYLIFFYFFGILGIQIYSIQTPIIKPEESPYSTYDEVANFNSFLYSQFYMVQILVEGGWSLVGYDYALRYGRPFMLTMLFFVCCHFSITLILSSLIKGVIWQIYEKVHNQLDKRTHKMMIKMKQQRQIKLRKEKLEEVKAQINLNQALTLQNLISRQIFENKVDNQITQKMVNALNSQNNQYFKKRQIKNRTQFIPHLIKDLNLFNVDELQMGAGGDVQEEDIRMFLMKKIITELNIKDEDDEQAIKNQDIAQQMQKLISKAVIDGNSSYTQTIVYPQLLAEFLVCKIKSLQQYNLQKSSFQYSTYSFANLSQTEPVQTSFISNFDVRKDQISKNQTSIKFLTHSLKSLLQISVSQRDQKAQIIANMIQNNIITQEQGKTLLQKKKEIKDYTFNPMWILRKTFLENTSESLVKKFQIEYFSAIYGQDFKQINKVTIQPLLRLQSKLMYSLRNALRYRQISDLAFFNIINQIEDQISRKLLKKGSLFKFVYQIDSLNQSWFSVKVKQNGQLKLHFIKNGIFAFHRSMKSNQIYLAKDMFYWTELQQNQDILDKEDTQQKKNKKYLKQRFIKMLFQSFQTLAFCLKSPSTFFSCDPTFQVYDYYEIFKNVEQTKRTKQSRFSISKIMAVILSNEGQRLCEGVENPLRYELTDLKINHIKSQRNKSKLQIKKKHLKFKLDQSQEEILEKLKKIENMDNQEIQQSQGLPHSFIVNFMRQIQDALLSYDYNFVYHVERIINKDPNFFLSMASPSAIARQSYEKVQSMSLIMGRQSIEVSDF